MGAPVTGKRAGHAPLEFRRQLRMGVTVGIEASGPGIFEGLAAASAIPGGGDVFGNMKGRVGPADSLAYASYLVLAKGCAMGGFLALLVGRAPTDDGLAANKSGCVAVGARAFDGAFHRARIVPVHIGYHLPAVCAETRRRVVGEPTLHISVDGDAVIVVEDDQLTESQGAGEGTRLVGYAFHQATIADKYISIVIDDDVVFAIELRGEYFFGDGHADGVGEALAQWAGGGLDARCVAVLRMSRGHGVQLPEIFDFLHGQRIAGQVQQRVEQHRAVAVGQHEAIPVGPLWVAGIVTQEVVPQDLCDVRHSHGHARMPGLGTLNGVHAQRPNGIGKISTR